METKVCNFEGKRIPFMAYLLSAPENATPGEEYPLVIFLHGIGERAVNQTEKLTVYGIPKLLKNGKKIPAYVLAPQCPPGYIWPQLTEELKELIDKTIEAYPVDRARVSLTGLSMGGFGTWEMGMSYPGFFAALAPVCGGGTSFRAKEIGVTPVWAFHGEADPIVPVRNSLEMCDALRDAGGRVELTVLRYVGHNCWDFAYERTNLTEWLLAQRNDK